MLSIFSLEIIFASDLFFSKLAKYLLFFSPCSTVSAFEQSINHCILFSVIFSNVSFFIVYLFLVFQFFHDLMFPKYSAVILKISFSLVSSCFLVGVLVWVANLIVSFRIVPFIISKRVFGFASLFINEISVILDNSLVFLIK